MKKRVSTLTNISIKRASSNLSMMAKLKRKPTAPRSSGEGHGLGAMVKRILDFGRWDDPDEPSPECRHETRETYTVEEEPTESSPREPFESCDPVLEDVPEPRAVATETQKHNRFTTPIKRRKPEDDLARGIPGAFYESEHSPAPSKSSSSAASSVFSPDEGNLYATPDTTFSGDFEFKTPGTSPPKGEKGTPDRSDPVDMVTPSPRHDEEDPITSSSAKLRAAGADRSFKIKSNFSTDFKPGLRYGKRPPRAASHHLETPTKARAAQRDVASTSDEDEDEYEYEEVEEEDDEVEEKGAEVGGKDDDDDDDDDDKHLRDLFTHPQVDLEDVGQSEEHPHFKPRGMNQYDALERVLERIVTGVKPVVVNPGYVYIYKRDTAEGFLKIGQSKRNHGARMEEITKKCGHDVNGAHLVGEQEMAVAYTTMEKCVHDHLYECHYTDCRCAMTVEKRTGTGPGKKKRPCKTKHREWFKTSEERAVKVVKFWTSFIAAQPYDETGRLKLSWRKLFVMVWDEIPQMRKEGTAAFPRLEYEMKDALKRCKKSKGNPRADLSLSLSARSECKGSALDGVRGASDRPPLNLPVRPKRLSA